MRINKISAFVSVAILLIALSSCGGGGGGQKLLTGNAVNESGAALGGGSYSVQGSGLLGTILPNGGFAVEVSGTGNLILTNLAGGFKFKRTPFDATIDGGLNLGNVILPNDSLSKGWNSYRAGDLAMAVNHFQSHIDASGRDLGDAYNGLGWAQARSGDLDTAADSFAKALGKGLDDDVRTGLAATNLGRTMNGTSNLAEVISNLDLAVNPTGFYLSRPIHDSVTEDDLIGLRAMLNLLDGRIQAAITDRNAVMGNSDAKINTATEDMLTVLDFFLAD